MAWDDVEREALRQAVPARLVAMEAIHMVVLDALYSNTLSGELVFHGGTCIRLVHGGYRYSEDLDFASLLDDASIEKLMARTEKVLINTLPAVLGPGSVALAPKPRRKASSVRKWWVRFQRRGVRDAIRVKIEVGAFPSRRPTPTAVRPRPPAPYVVPLVTAEPPEELLADKVNALAQRAFLRGRDLFDIWFLGEALGAELVPELVFGKFADYRTADPLQVLRLRRNEAGGEALTGEIDSLLPAAQRKVLGADGYKGIIKCVQAVVDQVLKWG